jgi:methylmalonyl-CoA/ethylmalonyl-CoA epimerase
MEVDHIGYVVLDMNTAVKKYTDIYGFILKDDIIYDPQQHVHLGMLSSSNGYQVELIQPIDKKSPSYDFMLKGGGFHHFCYKVENIDDSINRLKNSGHLLITRPVAAPLLDKRHVAFLFSKADKQIIELVETKER